MKCAAHVFEAWGSHPCPNNALPGRTKCGVHDPERQAERRAKRGPTQFERDCARQKQEAAFERIVLATLEALLAGNPGAEARARAVVEQARALGFGTGHGWLLLKHACPDCAGSVGVLHATDCPRQQEEGS